MLPEPMFEHLRLGRADFLKGRLPDTLEQDCFVQSHMLQMETSCSGQYSSALLHGAQHSTVGRVPLPVMLALKPLRGSLRNSPGEQLRFRAEELWENDGPERFRMATEILVPR